MQSSVLLIKGKVLEAMDNRGLASDCYRQALTCDVHCFEAFDALIQHNMLTALEEQELVNSLPISQQCTPEESEILLILYKSKLKKYHGNTDFIINVKDNITLGTNVTNQNSIAPKISIMTPTSLSTPNIINEKANKSQKLDSSLKTVQVNDNLVICNLNSSLDLKVAKAEKLYYDCKYLQCFDLTERILKEDQYHSGCLPIHISCLVELKRTNST